MGLLDRAARILRAEATALRDRLLRPGPDAPRGSRHASPEGAREAEPFAYARPTDPPPRPPPPPPRDPLAAHWAALELPPGSSLEAVRAAHRRLAKRYHPDRHPDPAKRAAAMEVMRRLNAARDALERHLGG